MAKGTNRKGYGGMITREQFCFYETRTVAKLMCEGKSEEEILEEVVSENLLQYPTERTVLSVAKACYKRMEILEDMNLVNSVAYGASDTAKQICLYGMMRQYPIVRDFMVNVVGEKYRLFDMSFGAIDLNTFFMQLREENEEVAGWSDSTIAKLKQVLRKILIETEYLDNVRSTTLNPVLIESVLEEHIRETGDTDALPAFNCLY